MIDLQMKLNPCPKCGGHPVVYQTSRWLDGQEDFTIRCWTAGSNWITLTIRMIFLTQVLDGAMMNLRL